MTIRAKILCAMAVSGFAAFAAISPTQALTAQECSAKYQAAKTAGTLAGQKWNDFRKAQCGADAAAAPAAAPTAAPAAAPKEAKKEAAPAAAPAVVTIPRHGGPSGLGRRVHQDLQMAEFPIRQGREASKGPSDPD